MPKNSKKSLKEIDSEEQNKEKLDINNEDYYSNSEITDSEITDSEITDSRCNYEEIVEGDDHENIYELDDNYDIDVIRKGDDRISLNRMTKYEMVRIIGERLKQLTLGAKCFIKNKEDFDYETLAKEELRAKLSPIKIIRYLPNNIIEEWYVEELQVDHLFK
tara:strand:+ start:42 stop:527 length:486 start_codon:yes stop_codon:yes gene_type:complete